MSAGNGGSLWGLTGKNERQFAQSYNFYYGKETKSMGFGFVTNSTVFPILIRSMKFLAFFQLMMNTEDNLNLEHY